MGNLYWNDSSRKRNRRVIRDFSPIINGYKS